MSREFGIYPENMEPRQWWGARAIVEKINGEWRFSLLYDRQNYERESVVSDTDKADLFWWMENVMDAELQKRVREDYFFRTGDELFVLTSEAGRFRCEARARNSGGYLYIGVWEV